MLMLRLRRGGGDGVKEKEKGKESASGKSMLLRHRGNIAVLSLPVVLRIF
jgi:hypothetical protein